MRAVVDLQQLEASNHRFIMDKILKRALSSLSFCLFPTFKLYFFTFTPPLSSLPVSGVCIALAIHQGGGDNKGPCPWTCRKSPAIDWHDEQLFPCSYPAIPIIPLS